MPARTAAPPTPNRAGSWTPAALPPPVAGAPLGVVDCAAHAALTALPSAVNLGSLKLPEALPASRSMTKVLTVPLTADEPVDAACVSSLAKTATSFFSVLGCDLSMARKLTSTEVIFWQAPVLAGRALAIPAPASTKTPAPASTRTPAPSTRPAVLMSFPMSPPYREVSGVSAHTVLLAVLLVK